MSDLVGQAAGWLRANGGRMTVQRRIILSVLDDLGGHPTAEQIYRAARRQDASINPSTVYRTLGWLAQAGLVSALRLGADRRGGARAQFESSAGGLASPGPRKGFVPAEPAEHYHFVCTSCGAVIEFDTAGVERVKEEFMRVHSGVLIQRATVVLYGCCRDCQAGSKA